MSFERSEASCCLALYEKCMIVRDTTHQHNLTTAVQAVLTLQLQNIHFSEIRGKKYAETSCFKTVLVKPTFWLQNIKVRQYSNSCFCKINATWMHVGRQLWATPLLYCMLMNCGVRGPAESLMCSSRWSYTGAHHLIYFLPVRHLCSQLS